MYIYMHYSVYTLCIPVKIGQIGPKIKKCLSALSLPTHQKWGLLKKIIALSPIFLMFLSEDKLFYLESNVFSFKP